MKTINTLDTLRHTCSHLLAASILDLYPGSKHTLGPAIDNGFYYDFEIKGTISEIDFEKIEKHMRKLLLHWNEVTYKTISKNQALQLFHNNQYKIELINEITNKNEPITIYTIGNFTDLCKGGHLKTPSKEIKYFKLLSISGAYWRGDEKNTMLTRIYGTAFFTQQELNAHLNMLDEAKKRDHRKLGRDLDLFTFSTLVGSGLPLYTPKGAFIRNTLNAYVEKIQSSQDFYQVWTPQIAKAELFKTSGHYDKYKADMFQVKSHYSDEEFYLKPMNCPQHTQIYASKSRSYKDLPIRITDFAMLYRDEKPGELNGLGRVRSFSQDDCHIFCKEDQVDHEIDIMLTMTKTIMNTFGFSYKYRLSTRDITNKDKYLGDPKIWDKVEKWAIKIMQRNKISYIDGPGEAAFYAPKMDLIATDALGREWQLSTVQIDYVMPERFNLYYIDEKGKKQRPVMLHRAIIGSPERFIMILLEHYAGALPVWLSPIQVVVVPISDRHIKHALKYYKILKNSGITVELNKDNKTLGSKIREHTLQKIPYICIIGDKEVNSNNNLVSIRQRDDKKILEIPLKQFIAYICEKIQQYK